MAITGQDIIDLVRERYADFETSFEARDLQWAHDEIVKNVRILPESNVDVSLVADTTFATYGADVARIWAASYYRAADDKYALRETSEDDLDAQNPGWRTHDSSGNCDQYFDIGGQIGLYPKPDTTTVAGYPKVVLHCSERESFGLADAIPAHITDPEPWVSLICYRFAQRRARDEAQAWGRAAASAVQSLSNYVMGVTARRHPGARRGFPTIRNS